MIESELLYSVSATLYFINKSSNNKTKKRGKCQNHKRSNSSNIVNELSICSEIESLNDQKHLNLVIDSLRNDSLGTVHIPMPTTALNMSALAVHTEYVPSDSLISFLNNLLK